MNLKDNKALQSLKKEFDKQEGRRRRRINVNALAYSSIAPELSKKIRANMPKQKRYKYFMFNEWHIVHNQEELDRLKMLNIEIVEL